MLENWALGIKQTSKKPKKFRITFDYVNIFWIRICDNNGGL